MHTVNPGHVASCTSPFWPKPRRSLSGMSADQIAAREIGQDTPFPSLELCTEVKRGSSGAACSAEFGCGLGSTISFRTPAQPLPMEHNPRKLFYRLFGQGDTAAEREAIIAQTGSSARPRERERRIGAQPARPGRPGAHGRVPGLGARDRAPSRRSMADQDFSKLDLPDAPAGVPANVRRAHQADVRPRGACLSGGSHARRVVHDGGRDQHADLQPGRHLRGVPSAVAPSEQCRQDGAARRRADVSLDGVRAVSSSS